MRNAGLLAATLAAVDVALAAETLAVCISGQLRGQAYWNDVSESAPATAMHSW